MEKKKNAAAPQAEVAAPFPTEEAIAELAYSHWESEGRPDGAEMDYWLRAERELRKRNGTSAHDDEGVV